MILNADQLAEIRRGVITTTAVGVAAKANVNAAIQAVEDWWEANRGTTSSGIGLSTAIDLATTPFVFTNPQKQAIVKFWLMQRIGRE
jgi:hypothetical protein